MQTRTNGPSHTEPKSLSFPEHLTFFCHVENTEEMAEPPSPRSHDRRQQYRDGLPPFSLPPSSGFPLLAADDKSPLASGLHSPSSAYSVSAASSPGFQPASMSLDSKPASQHHDSGAQGQYYGGRKPLPGSPPQSSSPSRFGGHQLPPITSLLPPVSQYPHSLQPSQAPPGHHLHGPLAPPAGMAPHQHHPAMYMHQGFGQPPLTLPSLSSSGGPYHEFNMRVGGGVYPVSREPPQQDRPFKCDICTQCFSRNHDLKRHRRIHSATKPFPCPHCDKCFSRKDALKRHRYVKACSGKKSPPESEASSTMYAGDTAGEAPALAEEDEDDDEEQEPQEPSAAPSRRKSLPSTSSKPPPVLKELKPKEPKEPKVPRSMTSKFISLNLATPSTQTGKRWIMYTLENGDAAAPYLGITRHKMRFDVNRPFQHYPNPSLKSKDTT
ncbi:hypothetical protein B0T21DRAFT_405330 [Apiosordaria backusii]|uniref:C2H2-type domain-containing protein n=1 Tax=Apiosordaria backusii TaxID=314023 RepID=A0AA39ZY72_9PEZI|nr:hypothetical protein B0T21DRAFT_405330 [Apiosordaria backusii]